METKEITEIYEILSKCSEEVSCRTQAIALRKTAMLNTKSIVKIAFDTRRINSETEFNPRRGLQNYHRSEAFIAEATSQKIKNFVKLKKVLNELKDQFGKQPEWQDSYARILLSTLEKGLRTKEDDGDFSESQPSVGSLDYIEELLHVRYRLNLDNINSLSEKQLRKIILDKDEELTKRNTSKDSNDNDDVKFTRKDISNKSYDDLLSKLFDGVKADKDNKSVKRSVTITIQDDYLGDDQDKG